MSSIVERILPARVLATELGKALSVSGFAARSRRLTVLGGIWLCACGPRLDIGSDLLWATDHESNDLRDWYAASKGGLLPDSSLSLVNIVAGPAHSGRYSLKFTNMAASDVTGPGVYRELLAPPDAYYSAWYYIPRRYQTRSQWTIMKFQARSEADLSTVGQGHDLNLRTLPGGQVILYVFSHDPKYLQAPLADPPAFVPIETWFQLEVLYWPRTDQTGKLLVWLNDRLVYDLEQRRTATSKYVLWAPCNIGQDIQWFGATAEAGSDLSADSEARAPTDGGAGGDAGDAGAGGDAGDAGAAGDVGVGGAGAGGTSAMSPRISPELYVDDAAISLRRVTRSGTLFDDR